MLFPFTAGQKVTAAEMTAAFDNAGRPAYQSADQQVINSTAFVNSTYMTLPVVANAWYLFEALLIYISGTSADFKYNLALPAGSAMRQAGWTPTISVSSTNTTVAVDALDATGITGGALDSGNKFSMRPSGLIGISTTPGSATVQFAQNAAVATATILCTSSWMRLTRIL